MPGYVQCSSNFGIGSRSDSRVGIIEMDYVHGIRGKKLAVQGSAKRVNKGLGVDNAGDNDSTLWPITSTSTPQLSSILIYAIQRHSLQHHWYWSMGRYLELLGTSDNEDALKCPYNWMPVPCTTIRYSQLKNHPRLDDKAR